MEGVCSVITGVCQIEYSFDYFTKNMKNDYSLELTLTSDNEMDPPFTMTLPEESMVVPDLDIFPG